jgi:cell division protease FtsH
MAAASRARDRVHGAVALPPGRRRDAGSGEHADPVAKVTILSRGAALGVTEQLPAFERHLYPESHLTASLAVRLGGRAAEIIILAEPSTGSASDLAGATELATHMVREWGFSAKVGPVSYGPEGPSRDNPFAGRPYAEETQRSIDQEVARLLREAEDTATSLLRGHRDTLDRVVGLLLERETIDGADLAAIVGTPGPADHEPTGAPLVPAMQCHRGGVHATDRHPLSDPGAAVAPSLAGPPPFRDGHGGPVGGRAAAPRPGKN